jgi:hypothetical protein
MKFEIIYHYYYELATEINNEQERYIKRIEIPQNYWKDAIVDFNENYIQCNIRNKRINYYHILLNAKDLYKLFPILTKENTAQSKGGKNSYQAYKPVKKKLKHCAKKP